MSRIRRIFEKDLKAKVVLEALKKKIPSGISKKIRVASQPNFNMEVRGHRNLAAVLIRKQLFSKMFQQKLHARVGLLILENDFLKKSGLVPLMSELKWSILKIN
jgi:hypothetical protein